MWRNGTSPQPGLGSLTLLYYLPPKREKTRKTMKNSKVFATNQQQQARLWNAEQVDARSAFFSVNVEKKVLGFDRETRKLRFPI